MGGIDNRRAAGRGANAGMVDECVGKGENMRFCDIFSLFHVKKIDSEIFVLHDEWL